MSLKNELILGVIGALLMFALGRYSVSSPTIKTTENQTIASNTDKDKNTHKQTTTTVVEEPNGEKKTVITTNEDTISTTHKTGDVSTHLEQTITPPKTNTLNVSALAATSFSEFKPLYGVSVTKQVIGPITAGAFGLNNGTVGVSLGLSF